jgi:hypothetical protein
MLSYGRRVPASYRTGQHESRTAIVPPLVVRAAFPLLAVLLLALSWRHSACRWQP